MALSLRRPLERWFSRSPAGKRGAALYAAALASSRSPDLFTAFGVPDSLDGRFDSLALHVALLVRHLSRAPDGEALVQALYTEMFDDMDRSLREMGVGDLGVGRRVQAMAEALMGRIAAYGEGLSASADGVLEAALRRNLFGTVAEPPPESISALARYMRRSDERLAAQDFSATQDTRPDYAPLEFPR